MHYSESPHGVGYTLGGGSATAEHHEEDGQHLAHKESWFSMIMMLV